MGFCMKKIQQTIKSYEKIVIFVLHKILNMYKIYTTENGLIEVNNIDFNIRKLTWHRLDGPAYIRCDINGNIEYEEYAINNKTHRLNGPAVIRYNNGSITNEEYYIDSKRHRLDGPADIGYDNNGNIKYVAYWINDIRYTKENYHKELLKLKVQSL